MKKKISKAPAADRQADLDALAALPDDRIDTSDIPEQTDWSDAKRGLFYRPAGQSEGRSAVSRRRRLNCRLKSESI